MHLRRCTVFPGGDRAYLPQDEKDPGCAGILHDHDPVYPASAALEMRGEP